MVVAPTILNMSRFVNLEFGGESEDHQQEQQPVGKDEAYYFAKARAAFENGEFEPGLRLAPVELAGIVERLRQIL